MHFGEIHRLDLGQAGKNFAVYLGARLFEPGDDDLPECLELVGRKSSDFQIFKIGGKNSGDSIGVIRFCGTTKRRRPPGVR